MPLPLILLPHQHLPQQRPLWPSPTSTFSLYSPWKMEHPSQSNTSVNNHDEHPLHHINQAAEPSPKQVWECKPTVTNFYNIAMTYKTAMANPWELIQPKTIGFMHSLVLVLRLHSLHGICLVSTCFFPRKQHLFICSRPFSSWRCTPPKNLHVLPWEDVVGLLTPRHSINTSGLSLKAWSI